MGYYSWTDASITSDWCLENTLCGALRCAKPASFHNLPHKVNSKESPLPDGPHSWTAQKGDYGKATEDVVQQSGTEREICNRRISHPLQKHLVTFSVYLRENSLHLWISSPKLPSNFWTLVKVSPVKMIGIFLPHFFVKTLIEGKKQFTNFIQIN